MSKDGIKKKGLTRRGFLGAAAVSAVVGAGLAIGLKPSKDAATEPEHQSRDIPPGKLDDYYGFRSGGHSGEIRILGIPSMRELKRIPVFNYCSATGYGTTDFSKKLIGDIKSGDAHHVHPSYENGTYDGKYAYVNDKLNSRLGRIRLDYMDTDAVTQLPNVQGFHGMFPMRVRIKGMPYYVFCNAEFRNPFPNNGRDMEDPKKYVCLHTAVDGDTMEVMWQVRVSGNLDIAATDYKGRFSMATCYDSEEAVTLPGFMEHDADWAVFFNTKAIEEAVKKRDYTTIPGSKVPVVDGRKGSKGEGKYTIYIPVPKNPHGINVDPTGRYAVSAGKLSPTCTVIDLEKVELAFAGKIKPEQCIAAQPEIGPGPIHTAFDGEGNAYTSLFLDSAIVKWNIAAAIKQHQGDKSAKAVVGRIALNHQVAHADASMSETKEADGRWLVVIYKLSKGRFLPVGPRLNDNDQLIDISGGKTALVYDGPVHPEPHDCVIVRRDLIKTKKVYDPTEKMFDIYKQMAKEDGVKLGQESKVVRKGTGVRVYMTSLASQFGLTEFKVKRGDVVRLIITNKESVEDLSHSFALCGYGINFVVYPQQTVSAIFRADKAGMYWYYCSWFCHAQHLEMRGRMIVEPYTLS